MSLLLKTGTGMKRLESFAATICIWALIYFLVQQSYLGLTSPAAEIDSLVYHIPISRHILTHGWLTVPHIEQGWGYYPAVGETILAGLLLISGSFMNLFNILAVVLVFLVSHLLGKAFGLRPNPSLVYATVVSLLQPALRLVNTQTVDIWFQLFSLLSVLLLTSVRKSSTRVLASGAVLGMLAGTKYSGPFAVLLILLFLRRNLRGIRFPKLFLGFLPLILLGGFWYVRNWLLTANPFYPANLSILGFSLRGAANNSITDWYPLKSIFFYPGGVRIFLTSLVSEYAVWLVFLGYFLLRLFVDKAGGKVPLRNDLLRITSIGIALSVFYLFIPGWPKNMLSDLRYTLPGVSLMILGFFVYFSAKKSSLPLYAAVLSILYIFPLLTHHPKVSLATAFAFLALILVRKEVFGHINQ